MVASWPALSNTTNGLVKTCKTAGVPVGVVSTADGYKQGEIIWDVEANKKYELVPSNNLGRLELTAVEVTPGKVAGNLNVTGNLNVAGNTTLQGSLSVAGATTGAGGFLAPDDVAGDPSYSFTDDPTTGLRRVPGAPDQLNVEVANTPVADFKGNGDTVLHGNVILDPGKTVTAPGGVIAPNVQHPFVWGNASSGNVAGARIMDPYWSATTATTGAPAANPAITTWRPTMVQTLSYDCTTAPTVSGVTLELLANGAPLVPPLSLPVSAGGPLTGSISLVTPVTFPAGTRLQVQATKAGGGLGFANINVTVPGTLLP